MKQQLIFLSLLSLTLFACDQNDKRSTPPQGREDVSYDISSENLKDNDANYDADNTGKNVRDRSDLAKTPFDQSESDMDRTITQKIRQALVADDSLSTNAKNVKIITEKKGLVTLRGAVNSDKEKMIIANKAKEISGVAQVDNQLEVIQK